MRPLALTFALVIACGSSERAPEPPANAGEPDIAAEDTAAVDPAAVNPSAVPEPSDPGATCALGYTAVPPFISAAARAANRAALRLHGEGEYERSLAAFRAILEESPSYDAVRFNAACALARLGRREEAIAEVRALLCRDLPSFAPKVESDEDLASVREALSATVSALVPRYLAALDEGDVLTAARYQRRDIDPQLRPWSQAVVYRPESRRIVPMGPRFTERASEELLHSGMLVHREHRRLLVLRWAYGHGDTAWLPAPVPVELYEVPNGRRIFQERAFGEHDAYITLGLSGPDVALAESTDTREEGYQLRFSAAGRRRVHAAPPEPLLEIAGTSWATHSPSPLLRTDPDFAIRGNRLVTPAGEIELGPGHGRVYRSVALVNRSRGYVYAISAQTGECESPDRFVLDLVDLESRHVRRIAGREGNVALELGRDDAVYIEIDGEEALRRYVDPKKEEFESLPDGLFIDSPIPIFNSYC